MFLRFFLKDFVNTWIGIGFFVVYLIYLQYHYNSQLIDLTWVHLKLKQHFRRNWRRKPFTLYKKRTNKSQCVKMSEAHFNILSFICPFFI